MKLDDVYTGNWLKAVHLNEKPALVTIKKVTVSEFPQKDGTVKKQFVLHLKEFELPLGLNVTNARTVAKILNSRETDDWIDRQIVLYPTEVESFGEMVEAIRIRAPKKKGPVVPEFDDEPGYSTDEDVPF